MSETKTQPRVLGGGVRVRDERGAPWTILSADPFRSMLDVAEDQDLQIMRFDGVLAVNLDAPRPGRA